MYQMFRPNLGPSSVLDQLHGMVSCVCIYVQALGGGGAVGNAWTGNGVDGNAVYYSSRAT